MDSNSGRPVVGLPMMQTLRCEALDVGNWKDECLNDWYNGA